jgi:DNA topoisomerase III
VTERNQKISTQDNESGPSRMCNCELTAVQRTVLKEGPNQGRVFWRCPNTEKAQCEFFEWDDEPLRVGGRSMSGNQLSGGSGGSGGQSGNKCFKVCFEVSSFDNATNENCNQCDQEGHWASGKFILYSHLSLHPSSFRL